MVLPDDDPSRNSNPVTIEFPENKEYTDNAKLIKTDSAYLSSEFTAIDNGMAVLKPDSLIMIDAVTIKGQKKKPAEYVDKNAQQYKYSGAFTLYGKDFEFAQTFEDILYKLGAYYVDKKTKKVILRAISYIPKKMSISATRPIAVRPALFVVDNTPVYDRTYEQIAQILASEIASVTVLNGPQAFAQYGNDASNGVIFVSTKTGNRINGIQLPEEVVGMEDNSFEPTRLFRTEVEYYIPSKEQIKVVPDYQFRPTLLWKSDIYLDGSGPVKFKYPDNLRNGTVLIFVNGVSLTNLVGSDSFSYTIK
jgi:TonB-dependent SusC/RagA subfamily outer membrane receptor